MSEYDPPTEQILETNRTYNTYNRIVLYHHLEPYLPEPV